MGVKPLESTSMLAEVDGLKVNGILEFRMRNNHCKCNIYLLISCIDCIISFG